MKFKVGDKVRILPSAEKIGVFKSEVGRVGIIEDTDFLGQFIHIRMVKPYQINGRIHTWAVKSPQITPFIKVGEQLEFAFMEREVNYE